jgi:hypothetical protein
MGRNFLAHRVSTLRLRTVKVCERCLEHAKDAGYQIAQREPTFTDSLSNTLQRPA